MVLVESIAAYLANSLAAYLMLDGVVAFNAKVQTDLDRIIKNVDKERKEGETPKEYAKRHMYGAPWILPITNLVLKRGYHALEKAMEKRTDLEELAFLERHERKELNVLGGREKALRALSNDAAGLYANVVLNSASESYRA